MQSQDTTSDTAAERAAKSAIATIMRDVCEMDPCDPEAADAICILWDDLRAIIAREMLSALGAALDAQRGDAATA